MTPRYALPLPPTRRDFLRDSFCGIGSLALASLMAEERSRAGGGNPREAKPPHDPGGKGEAGAGSGPEGEGERSGRVGAGIGQGEGAGRDDGR